MAFLKKMEAIKNDSEERTYGHFPSAREIKLAERKQEAAKERDCLRLLHNVSSPSESGTKAPAVCSSPVRSQTRARATPQSSGFPPSSSRLRMPTTARPAYNRAQGTEVGPLYTQRLERSKTDLTQLLQQPEMNMDDPRCSEPTIPKPKESSVQSSKKPYFLTELQLPHLENSKCTFRNTVAVRPRHHFIHPDWISEGMIIKRLRIEHRSNPLLYGWI